MAKILAFQAGDPGSTPGGRISEKYYTFFLNQESRNAHVLALGMNAYFTFVDFLIVENASWKTR
jgi:hypothetical protein